MYQDNGMLKAPVFVSFVMGVASGMPADPEWLAISHDGNQIAVHCVDGKLLLLRAADGSTEWTASCAGTRDANTGDVPYPYFVGRYGTVLFSRDNKRIYTCGSPIVQAWDRTCGREIYRVANGSSCWAMAESPNGKILATGAEDGNVVLTNAPTGQMMGPPIVHGRQVVSVDFSAQGDALVTCSQDNEVRVWDVASRKLRHAMGSVAKLSDATFTPDGRFLAEASGPTVRLWDAVHWKVLTPTIQVGDFHTRIDVSVDGNWLTVGGSSAGERTSLPVLNLKQLTTTESRSQQEAVEWAELLSCGRIDGTAFVRLSNSEWMELWRKTRAKHPESETVTITGVPW